jgi:threonine dehydrogenase-like Zn-dependent dehydrogenase
VRRCGHCAGTARGRQGRHRPDPKIEDPRDAIIKVTACAICGSDLHLYDGVMPEMHKGDVLGHETMGEVVEVGPGAKHKLKVGDRVVIPFTISCGECFFCKLGLFAGCERSNPTRQGREAVGSLAGRAVRLLAPAGRLRGGQAEYIRVPYADVGPLKVPSHLTDEQVLFLSDIFPTGYMAAENCNIHRGDLIAIWGCGPVGLFAIRSAFMLGAERVIAIDTVPERWRWRARPGRRRSISARSTSTTRSRPGRTGAARTSCIDAVGTEAHVGASFDAVLDRVKQAVLLGTDRPHVLRQAIHCCRNGGNISIPGVYGGLLDNIPMGSAVNRGLTMRMGQTHMHRYMQPLLERIENGEIDPSFVITHRLKLDDAPGAYKTFRDKEDGCVKVFLTP